MEPDAMSTPSLTPDGHMLWPPRDWAESLCMRLADGTWLVQAPISSLGKPRIYLLPNAEMKDRYLFWAVGLIHLRIIVRAKYYAVLLVTASMPLWSMIPLLRGPFALFWLFLILFWPMYLIWHQQLFLWLESQSLNPPEGWRRPEALIRSGVEWEALYQSNGVGVERLLWLAGCGVVALVAVQATARYLNICQGIDILDPLVMDMTARDRRWFARDCDSAGMLFVFAILWIASTVFARRQDRRRWRSGGAVLRPTG
jgi:hypothetical protein